MGHLFSFRKTVLATKSAVKDLKTQRRREHRYTEDAEIGRTETGSASPVDFY
jgi:hypothetical protein